MKGRAFVGRCQKAAIHSFVHQYTRSGQPHSVSQSVSQSSIYPSIHPSIHSIIYLFTHLSIHSFMFPLEYLFNPISLPPSILYQPTMYWQIIKYHSFIPFFIYFIHLQEPRTLHYNLQAPNRSSCDRRLEQIFPPVDQRTGRDAYQLVKHESEQRSTDDTLSHMHAPMAQWKQLGPVSPNQSA